MKEASAIQKWREPHLTQKHFIHVTPRPIFTRLKGSHDRVAGGVKMFGGVAIRRRVAAAHMSAGQTEPQVDPGRTDFQTFLTAVRAGNDIGIDLIEVRAFVVHNSPFAQLHSHCYRRDAGMPRCRFPPSPPGLVANRSPPPVVCNRRVRANVQCRSGTERKRMTIHDPRMTSHEWGTALESAVTRRRPPCFCRPSRRLASPGHLSLPSSSSHLRRRI